MRARENSSVCDIPLLETSDTTCSICGSEEIESKFVKIGDDMTSQERYCHGWEDWRRNVYE